MKKLLFLLFIPTLIFSCKKSTTDVDHPKLDHETILKYIADSNLTGVDSTASGLYYIVRDSGVGPQPNTNSYVTFFYKGYLTNGTVFDQTTGTPVKYFLHSLIPGWIEGMQLIKKGGKITLLIPSALGYGGNASEKIPAYSVLIFDIELVDVQ
ncbi:MAG: FKBP-type peptidyl-prolyl cis-trans isomerase [Bacteroidota bacterium]|nr:FKBP-type peptidyl-prolyl cis-trans isomerase [Bacteroidota bacterium]